MKAWSQYEKQGERGRERERKGVDRGQIEREGKRVMHIRIRTWTEKREIERER